MIIVLYYAIIRYSTCMIYHVVLHDVVPYTLWYTTLCHVLLYYNYAIIFWTIQYYTISNYVMPCYAMLHCVCTVLLVIAGNNTCRNNEFRCQNGLCIPQLLQCDGQDNCGDGSDESSCGRNSIITKCSSGDGGRCGSDTIQYNSRLLNISKLTRAVAVGTQLLIPVVVVMGWLW